MLFAYDIMLLGENSEKLNSMLKEQSEALEGKGLKISRGNTEYLEYDFIEKKYGTGGKTRNKVEWG